ncbi:unnamed protein product [Pleuronectes platessa]|uniref:Uncharacterized protein n=1 Tax=Pleuronectes platessa TaxID=8262 RepID=A0A9N7UCM4_PLEPL|nr:unnamed protein product [Pleuronectes platessa]
MADLKIAVHRRSPSNLTELHLFAKKNGQTFPSLDVTKRSRSKELTPLTQRREKRDSKGQWRREEEGLNEGAEIERGTLEESKEETEPADSRREASSP